MGVMAVAATAVLSMASLAGFAQDKLAEIKDRREFMKAQGADVKAIQEYAKGAADSDQQKALAAANDLLSRAPKITALFVPGTSTAEFPDKTHAKPDIWQNWDKFKAIPTVLETQEQKLVEAIKTGNREAVGTQLGVTGKNGCGACHQPFRTPLT